MMRLPVTTKTAASSFATRTTASTYCTINAYNRNMIGHGVAGEGGYSVYQCIGYRTKGTVKKYEAYT